MSADELAIFAALAAGFVTFVVGYEVLLWIGKRRERKLNAKRLEELTQSQQKGD